MSLNIPDATLAKLNGPAVKGQRHKDANDIAHALFSNNPPTADVEIASLLRGKFLADDFTEREILDIVKWHKDHPGEPCGQANGQPFQRTYQPRRQQPAQPTTQPEFKTPTELVEWWTNGARLSADKMANSSPVGLPECPVDALKLFFASLYSDTDHINLVAKHVVEGEKAKPIGGGNILPRDGWIKYFSDNGVVESNAGCWMRMNPCNATGSGKDGAPTDADVSSYRFILLESDTLPITMQLAFFYRLKLPIAAVILSGGGSAHAWVRVNAINGERYGEVVNRLLASLEKFGIDKANKNPSRLSRCPSATRVIGAQDGGLQRLLWLNPNAPALTDETITQFEQSLLFPAIEERPLAILAQQAIVRYEWMRENKGKLGVPYGIPAMDKLTGGLKPGQTMVVAGETGQGKSTYALHMVKAALDAGIGVLLFSLEMDKEEIFDLLLSDKCSVDRNKFNNGEFGDHDMAIMAEKIKEVMKLPLYIEDSPMTGAEQARMRTHQLLAAKKIGLVVVDYIQFMNPGWTKDTSREQQVASISHTLRALARETKLPFVILSQLNDKAVARIRVIAHNANVVARITTERDTATVEVIKGRGIPTGKYNLDYNRMFARLVGLDPNTDANHNYPD